MDIKKLAQLVEIYSKVAQEASQQFGTTRPSIGSTANTEREWLYRQLARRGIGPDEVDIWFPDSETAMYYMTPQALSGPTTVRSVITNILNQRAQREGQPLWKVRQSDTPMPAWAGAPATKPAGEAGSPAGAAGIPGAGSGTPAAGAPGSATAPAGTGVGGSRSRSVVSPSGSAGGARRSMPNKPAAFRYQVPINVKFMVQLAINEVNQNPALQQYVDPTKGQNQVIMKNAQYRAGASWTGSGYRVYITLSVPGLSGAVQSALIDALLEKLNAAQIAKGLGQQPGNYPDPSTVPVEVYVQLNNAIVMQETVRG